MFNRSKVIVFTNKYKHTNTQTNKEILSKTSHSLFCRDMTTYVCLCEYYSALKGNSTILGDHNPKTPRTDWQKIWRGWLRRRWLPACQTSKRTPHWGRGDVCVKYHPRVVFSARCNIYISRLCYDVNVRLSVHLSVTEVHWRIIANLGFKFRSQFTAHCGRGACGREHWTIYSSVGAREGIIAGMSGVIISRYASHC